MFFCVSYFSEVLGENRTLASDYVSGFYRKNSKLKTEANGHVMFSEHAMFNIVLRQVAVFTCNFKDDKIKSIRIQRKITSNYFY